METEEKKSREISELVAIVEALVYVADEPVTMKTLSEVLDEERDAIRAAVEELQREYETRGGGLQLQAAAARFV
ncbi:MAG TPA: SMC-Scp complex subunit ScpB, partial [Pyrinomonadaceae bacterium]|nr:SMC-Scp complex subunit ScpB [Pyrinomonadaceae bacterium]